MWASGELTVVEPDPTTPDGAEFEAGPKVKVRTHDAGLARFLAEVAAAFPLGLKLDAASEDPRLADHVFRLFTTQIVQLTTAQWPLAAVPGERPRVSALARLQAENGESVLATLRHQMVKIEDASVLALIALIDGTRTREELALAIARREEAPDDAAPRLDEILAKLAKAGLMAG